MMVSMVAAMSDNGVIGRDNALPWRLPADMRRFRRLTLGKAVLMGRRTFDSIGKALPGRLNIVLTRDAGFRAPGCEVVNTLEQACAAADSCDELAVIGGADIYRQWLPLAQRLYLTVVHAEVEGDARFPPIDPSAWETVAAEHFPADEENPFAFSFLELHRR